MEPTNPDLVQRNARALAALLPAAQRLEPAALCARVAAAAERGYFRPDEEDELLPWFARFLTIREGLWQIIAELSEPFDKDLERVESKDDLRAFLLAYAAACVVVRIDRLLVETLATDTHTQRKLNEGSVELRIPRKQFTAVHKSLVDPSNALLLHRAMKLAARERERCLALTQDADVGFVARELDALEAALDPSKRRYLERLLQYGEHSLRRRGASTQQQVAFSTMESGGRVVAELRERWREKRVGESLQREIAALLQPGDVIVTRHDRALTNLFLPGFWPHVALYVGSHADRERLGIELEPERAQRWCGERRVLEAQKDGVQFRELAETLAVDAVVVVRPRLEGPEIARAIERAARHEGKLYNFDFDFFRSDRLVCTEVVYRGYDGVGSLEFELSERAGRRTLSAEDILDHPGFEVVAVTGVGERPGELIVGAAARPVVDASYR